MVLGLRSKKRITSIQVEYTVEVLEIKPWPVSQSQKSIRSVVLQWETGDRKFGLTNPITPSISEGKIEINESFRVQVTLMKETSGKSNGSGSFLKNILQFYLHEHNKGKAVKGQLGNAVLDLAQHGVVKDFLVVAVPMSFKRGFRNINQPVLYVKLQSFEKNDSECSSSESLSKEVFLDMEGKGSVLALMSEEYAEEDEIASFTDEDDATSHSSFTHSCSFVGNNEDSSLGRSPEEKSQSEQSDYLQNVSETTLKVDCEEYQKGSNLIAKQESFLLETFHEEHYRPSQISPPFSIDSESLGSDDLDLTKSHICLETSPNISGILTHYLSSHHEEQLETTFRISPTENSKSGGHQDVHTNLIDFQTELIVNKIKLNEEINPNEKRRNTSVSNFHSQKLSHEQRVADTESSTGNVRSKERDCSSGDISESLINLDQSCGEENDMENGAEEDQNYHSYTSDRFSVVSIPIGERAQAAQQHEHLTDNISNCNGNVLTEKSNGALLHARRMNMPFSVRSPPHVPGSNENANSNQCLEDVNEIVVLEDVSNSCTRPALIKGANDAINNFSGLNSIFFDKKVLELEYRTKMLEGELREAAAMEMSLYSVVAEHGSSMHKVHTPARRLSRLYLYASELLSGERRAGAARSIVSGLVMVAKSCGNDIPRLTFWLSNLVVLRAVISHGIGQSENPIYDVHSMTDKSTGTMRKDKKFQFKWESIPLPNKKFLFNREVNDWDNPQTFVAVLEKVEAWIFSRIVESVWWQTFAPYVYSKVGGESKLFSQWKKVFERKSSPDEKIQKSCSFEIWEKALNDARERLCPVRAEGHECGCLPILSKQVMEQCMARLDVTIFNALLHESDDGTSNDPVDGPIINHLLLPIPPGKSSFGAGAQLKNVIGNWSRSLTVLFDMDVDDSSPDKNNVYDERVDVTDSRKPFHLLNALSDIYMLPKLMLLEEKVRKEVCPAFSSSVIKRIISSFFPDEFCPDHVPESVFEALDSEDKMVTSEEGMITNLPCNDSPITYSPPPVSTIKNIIGDVQSTSHLNRSRSSVFRKCYASDDDLEELDSPFSTIIFDKSSFSSLKENEKTSRDSFRYQLLRDVWEFHN